MKLVTFPLFRSKIVPFHALDTQCLSTDTFYTRVEPVALNRSQTTIFLDFSPAASTMGYRKGLKYLSDDICV